MFPNCRKRETRLCGSSPRLRGCFRGWGLGQRQEPRLPRACGGVSYKGPYRGVELAVFPAPAGVFLSYRCSGWSVFQSSPRLRGCFYLKNLISNFKFGLPRACGGVSRSIVSVHCFEIRLPRACGGVSAIYGAFQQAYGVFPAPAGCFQIEHHERGFCKVFPAPAGVFPPRGEAVKQSFRSSPRLRGCFWLWALYMRGGRRSSPRLRGCFLRFKCYRAMEQSLPRACGGVSLTLPWLGCEPQVYPAPAGVFPVRQKAKSGYSKSSPRLRGCFSCREYRSTARKVSSPRLRGCFYPHIYRSVPKVCLPRACRGVSLRDLFDFIGEMVFPAPAGVFLIIV